MDEDDTTKPEPSGDAPALDRATAAAASGPASVRTQARAPLLLQPAVGHAGAPTLDDSWADDLPEVRPLSLDAKRLQLGRFSEDVAGVPPTLSGPLDDAWADNLPEVRPLSQDAKRFKLGKGSGPAAGVSPTSSGPSSSAALPLVQPPSIVDVVLAVDGEEVRMVFEFQCFQQSGQSLWRELTTDETRVAAYGLFLVNGCFPAGLWLFSEDGNRWHEQEGAVTEPPPSSWQ